MKAFLKHFFFEFKEWCADVRDHISMVVVDRKIDDLNEDLKEEFNSFERHYIIVELELYSAAHNAILGRVRAREVRYAARHSQVVAH